MYLIFKEFHLTSKNGLDHSRCIFCCQNKEFDYRDGILFFPGLSKYGLLILLLMEDES